jgi:integrase
LRSHTSPAVQSISARFPIRHALDEIVFVVEKRFASLLGEPRVRPEKVASQIADQKHGHRLVRDLEPNKARAIIHAIGSDRPGMANLTISILKKLMAYAMKIGMRDSNPVVGIDRYRQGSHHTWTEDELAAYEARWPLGTRERLAFALLLYTGQRVGDVSRLKRSDIAGGTLRLVQEKTGTPLTIPIHPALDRAIRAGPTNGINSIGDKNGRPMLAASLSGLVSRAAAVAGLPNRCKPHGLRKAILRRLAEHGATAKQIAAVSGHKTLGEVARYTRAADQAVLSKAAIDLLPDEE